MSGKVPSQPPVSSLPPCDSDASTLPVTPTTPASEQCNLAGQRRRQPSEQAQPQAESAFNPNLKEDLFTKIISRRQGMGPRADAEQKLADAQDANKNLKKKKIDLAEEKKKIQGENKAVFSTAAIEAAALFGAGTELVKDLGKVAILKVPVLRGYVARLLAHDKVPDILKDQKLCKPGFNFKPSIPGIKNWIADTATAVLNVGAFYGALKFADRFFDTSTDEIPAIAKTGNAVTTPVEAAQAGAAAVCGFFLQENKLVANPQASQTDPYSMDNLNACDTPVLAALDKTMAHDDARAIAKLGPEIKTLHTQNKTLLDETDKLETEVRTAQREALAKSQVAHTVSTLVGFGFGTIVLGKGAYHLITRGFQEYLGQEWKNFTEKDVTNAARERVKDMVNRGLARQCEPEAQVSPQPQAQSVEAPAQQRSQATFKNPLQGMGYQPIPTPEIAPHFLQDKSRLDLKQVAETGFWLAAGGAALKGAATLVEGAGLFLEGAAACVPVLFVIPKDFEEKKPGDFDYDGGA